MPKRLAHLLLIGLLMLAASLAAAQDATPEPGGEAGGPPEMQMPPLPEGAEVVAQGLNFPRHLFVAADGTIYVAETGVGGETTMEMPAPDGSIQPVPFGYTGSVTAVTADGQSQLIQGLPGVGGEPLGPSSVAVTGDSIWVITNGLGPGGMPPSIMGSLLQFSAEGFNHLLRSWDLSTFEAENDPDGNGFDSNPVDVSVAPDGTVFVVDAGSNAVYRLTEDGTPEVFHAWPENPVPTGVAFGDDGSVYVSFLGAELAPGAGHVERLNADGEVEETWSGFNALTDVAVAADGTVYAVSLISGFGEQGPLPGQVLRVNGDGGEVVVDGLMLPYGIAFDADGNMLLTVGTVFVPPGAGMVLKLPAPGM